MRSPFTRTGSAVDADRVLGQVTAVGNDECERSGLAADTVYRLGDGVHAVIVARAPEKRQAAGEGEPAIGRGVEFHRGARAQYRDREATVGVDVVDGIDCPARALQGTIDGEILRL